MNFLYDIGGCDITPDVNVGPFPLQYFIFGSVEFISVAILLAILKVFDRVCM